jgi:hypothetical protein
MPFMKAWSIRNDVEACRVDMKLVTRLTEVLRDLSSSIRDAYSVAAPLQSLRAHAISFASLPSAMRSPTETPNPTAMVLSVMREYLCISSREDEQSEATK